MSADTPDHEHAFDTIGVTKETRPVVAQTNYRPLDGNPDERIQPPMRNATQSADAAQILSDIERDARQVAFNMPATWEHMQALGLDPLTGEPN